MDLVTNAFNKITSVPGQIMDTFGWMSPPVLLIMFVNMILLIVVIVKLVQYLRGEGFAQPGEKATMYYMPWCGYCKNDIPAFEKLAEKYKGNLTFETVNCQETPVTGISSYPTYIFTKADGSKIGRASSFGDQQSMDTFIREVFGIDAWEKEQAIKAAQQVAAQQAVAQQTTVTQ